MERPQPGQAQHRPRAGEAGVQRVLHELIRQRRLPDQLPARGPRAKLGIDARGRAGDQPGHHLRRAARGFGARGPEADKGGYDGTGLLGPGRQRGTATPPRLRRPDPACPAGAYGDSIGGMTIAGGIAAALFARARTGETSVVDVSLLGVGAWASQFRQPGAAWPAGRCPKLRPAGPATPTNPLTGTYRTADERWLSWSCSSPAATGRSSAEQRRAPGTSSPTSASTPAEKLMANARRRPRSSPSHRPAGTKDEWIAAFAGHGGPVGRRAEHLGGRSRPGAARESARSPTSSTPRVVPGSWSPTRSSSTRGPDAHAWPAVRRAHRRDHPRARRSPTTSSSPSRSRVR